MTLLLCPYPRNIIPSWQSTSFCYPKRTRCLQHAIEGIINMVEGITIRSKKQTPGSKPNPCHSFSICYWDLNSLTVHNYLKVSLLRAYVAISKFYVVCLSKISLDSSNLSDDNNFNIDCMFLSCYVRVSEWIHTL